MTENARRQPARYAILLWFTFALWVGVGFAFIFAGPLGVPR